MIDVDPEFLELEDVFDLHADSIARYGGDLGIRDRGLIESAVAVPRQSFGGEYLHRTLFEMAAAYAFHLAPGRRGQTLCRTVADEFKQTIPVDPGRHPGSG